jgi:peptidoglycan L-alanyl-D-glutamate endopeptidase CwlK
MRAPMTIPPGLLPRKPLAPTPVEFSAHSKELLKGVNPTLADLMFKVEAAHPDAFEISEGMRSKDRQADMVAQGKSQTMNSRHLGGNAVDIAMIGADGQPNWNFEDYRPIADTARATAASLGIPDFVWGGDWKTLKDGVHFQVGGPAAAAESAGGGAGLSFGAGVPAAPTDALGLAGMFADPGAGLNMGVPVDPFAGRANSMLARRQQQQDEAAAVETRRMALLSGIGAMYR